MFSRLKYAIIPIVLILGLSTMTGCEQSTLVDQAIRKHFPSQVSKAYRVARCESTLNPHAVSPGGANNGLFQINRVHAGTFKRVTGKDYYPWVFSADVNAYFASWLQRQQGWRPWTCGGA